MTSQQPVKIAIDRRPHTAAILDGQLPPPRGLKVEFVEVKPINRAFRRMIRDNEFGISEMAIATHYIARAHGHRFQALPVFLARHYPHAALQLAVKNNAELAKANASTRIGSRSYTMTTAVWARGVLAAQCGVPLDEVTWVVADEEHVPGTALPPNVEYRPGADLKAMLATGELQAGIGLAVPGDDAKQLWPDPDQLTQAEHAWLAATGAAPMNHTLVISENLLNNDLAEDIFAWFAESERLATEPTAANTASETSYGLTPANRRSLEVLLDLTRQQLPGEPTLTGTIDDYFLAVGQ